MWILFALLAALFSGLTTVFAKASIIKANSTLVTGLRTIVIVIFTVIVYFLFKSPIKELSTKTIIYLILSGITTALLWISYFKALSLANVNEVTPIDKTSIILTLILSSIFLKEKITINKIISIILILSGTYLMVKKNAKKAKDNKWLLFAILTAIFTSLATILGKIGIKDIDPNFGTMIRTLIVLIIIWAVIILKKEYKDIKIINKKNILFITLSGISTGLSWLFYFLALKKGEASIVFPIEKMSVVVAIVSSAIFLKEKLNKKAIIGLILLFISTIVLIL